MAAKYKIMIQIFTIEMINPAIARPFPFVPCSLHSLIPTMEKTMPSIPKRTSEHTKPAMHIPLVGAAVVYWV